MVEENVGSTVSASQVTGATSGASPVLPIITQDAPDIASNASKFISTLQESSSALGSFKDILLSFGGSASDIIKSIASAAQAFSFNSDSVQKLSQSFTSAAGNFSGVATTIANVAETSIIGTFKSIDSIAKDRAVNNSIAFSQQATGPLKQVVSQLPFGIGQAITKDQYGILSKAEGMAQSADAFTNLRSVILTSAAAAGKLNDTIGDMSNIDMSRLNDQIARSGAEMIRSSMAIGVSSENYIKAYTSLQSEVPNFFKNNPIDVAGSKLDETQAVFALSEGTRRSFDSIKGDIQSLGKVYNLSSSESLDYIAKLSKVNDNFKIGSDAVKSFFDKNIQAFSYQITKGGDDSVEALNRMMKGFTDTGLSAKQAAELIGEITSGIGSMDVAQKAFLSSQSGGPGGLRGAFEIESLISKGKIEEVLAKVEGNIKKNFGGKIYTLKDAQESDYAASQFQKQREMLKSGAFGVSIANDAKASRVLEYLSGDSKGDASNLKDAFQEYAGSGRKMLEQNVTAISALNGATELEQMAQSARNVKEVFDLLALKKEEIKLLNDEFSKIKEKNKNPKSGEDINDIAPNTFRSVARMGGRLGGVGSLAVAITDRNASITERADMAKDGAGRIFTGAGPKELSKEGQEQYYRASSASKKDADTQKPKQKTTQARSAVSYENAYQSVTDVENLLNNNKQTKSDRGKQMPTDNALAYQAAPAKLDPKTQAYSVDNRGNSAVLPERMVVPTVEMHVDMSCPNCAGKKTEVVVLKAKTNETGGLTASPRPTNR